MASNLTGYVSGDIRNEAFPGRSSITDNPSPATEIQSTLASIESEISIMMDRVTSLHDALQPIMLPTSPTGEGRTADRSTETPLGIRLGHQRDNLRNINGSLLELLARIAL